MKYSDEHLLDEMNRQNPWWRKRKIELEEGLIERNIFNDLRGKIDSHRITGLIGLRRTGKTTVLYQLISRIMEEHEPKRILYFSFDAMEKQDMIVGRILSLYFQKILREIPEELKEKVFVFFDEIQKVESWGEEIKSFWDKKYPVKFFVSGSSSMNIMKGSGESLVGRIDITRIHAFGFTEYMKYHGVNFCRYDLHALMEGDYEYPTNGEKLKLMFNNYLEEGGFPELYREEDKIGYISDVLSLTFYRDIVNLLPVKKPEVLEGLFHQFINQSGKTINYNKLSDALDTRYETIKNYMDYLETSFLIDRSYLYSENRLKRYRKNPKVYISDHCFTHLELLEPGLKVETVVFNHLKVDHDIFYGDNDHETDIVLEHDNDLIPIEVKYKNSISHADLKGIRGFMEEHGLEKGIVVSKKDLKKENIDGKRLIFVPAWLFLLTK